MDLTIYSGSRHRHKRIFDLKLFRKPTDLGLHLCRNSHHPEHTFKAILTNTAARSLINCSNEADWLATLSRFYREHLARGYTTQELKEHLMDPYKHSDRQRLLEQTQEANQSGVLALKVPFTSRAETLQLREQLRHLEDYIPTVPGVGNTFESTRFVVAELKTPNVISMTRSR